MRVDRENPHKYFNETDASYEARRLWYAFKDTVFYKNRFFVKHKLLDILSQYIRSLGYDGIRFNSSLQWGSVNLALFNSGY